MASSIPRKNRNDLTSVNDKIKIKITIIMDKYKVPDSNTIKFIFVGVFQAKKRLNKLQLIAFG